MAVADILARTKTILYGQGLGEKPALRTCAADAAESISGDVLSFNVASGEGASIKPGDVLATAGQAEANAHVLYVLTVSTDALTAYNGYLGSPVVADTNLDGVIVEQNPLTTDHEVYEAIDTIFANMLWPHIWDETDATISAPDLVDGQEAIAAAAEKIISAHQVIGPTIHNIDFTPHVTNLSSSLKTNSKMATFRWINGTTGYYRYKEKFAEADEAGDELTRLVATGAAAFCLGGALTEATLESTKKDNSEAVSQRQAVGSSLWRDFLTLRQNMSEEQWKRQPDEIIVLRN